MSSTKLGLAWKLVLPLATRSNTRLIYNFVYYYDNLSQADTSGLVLDLLAKIAAQSESSSLCYAHRSLPTNKRLYSKIYLYV